MDLFFELSYVMDREIQLLCLFKNGKDGVVNLLEYFLSCEHTTIYIKEVLQQLKNLFLGIYPRILVSEESSLTEIRCNLKKIVFSKFCTDLDVSKLVEHVLLLALFIGNSNSDTYDHILEEGLLENEDFPNVRSWEEFWTFNCEIIMEIFSYLHEKNFIPDRKFFQRQIEMEYVLPYESKELLHRVYPDEIQHHYNVTTSLPTEKNFFRRWRQVMKFDLQLVIAKVEQAVKSEGTCWFNFRKHFGRSDMALDSEMSNKVSFSVENVFREYLGVHNDERYSVYMYCVDNESIKILGKEACECSYYDIVIEPPDNSDIPDHYDYCLSSESKAYLEKMKNVFDVVIYKNMGYKTFLGINRWRFGHTITTSGYIIKENAQEKWTIAELYELDKSLDEAMATLNDQFDDLKIKSMKSFYRKQTGNLNYCFQVSVHSAGLLEIVEHIIPIAQSTVMNIKPY